MIKLTKNVGALYAAATVAAAATMGTGCVSMNGNGQGNAQAYSAYLDPRAEGFQVLKEAYENQGKKVEATFVPNEQGQMVAVYGVRDKTFMERTNDHLNANEGIYKNMDRALNLGLKTTDTIYNIKGVHRLDSISRSERSQSATLRVINGTLQSTR